jgi:hypothetical protein
MIERDLIVGVNIYWKRKQGWKLCELIYLLVDLNPPYSTEIGRKGLPHEVYRVFLDIVPYLESGKIINFQKFQKIRFPRFGECLGCRYLGYCQVTRQEALTLAEALNTRPSFLFDVDALPLDSGNEETVSPRAICTSKLREEGKQYFRSIPFGEVALLRTAYRVSTETSSGPCIAK